MGIHSSRNQEYRREIMIREHLVGRGIRDPAVLAAMRQVPREAFVDQGMRELAYEDHPLPIDGGQTGSPSPISWPT